MKRHILSKDQVYELVTKNKYKIKKGSKFLSRCVDGRYLTSDSLPPLAIPGADAGQLGLIFAAANSYGFEVDQEKAFKVLVDVVGGESNFNFHTDEHGDQKIPASGCGHLKQQNLDPEAYNLNEAQLNFIKKILIRVKQKGAIETVLEGDHQEGAVLQIQGDYSLSPQAIIDTFEGKSNAQVFIFQSSLTNQRNKLIAKKLIAESAVKLFPGCDEEYLYTALTEVTENHVFETLKRLANGLPIFEVNFDKDGTFKIKELGNVEEN